MLPQEGFTNYIQFGAWIKGRKAKRYRYIFWHVVTWSIWLLRNDMILNGGRFDLINTMDLIKIRGICCFRTGVQARSGEQSFL